MKRKSLSRLRRSYQELAASQFAIGEAAGRAWAEECADAEEIENIKNYQEEATNFGQDDFDDHVCPGCVFCSIHDVERTDEDEVSEFWLRVTGSLWPTRSMLIGFIAGAIGVREEVLASFEG